MLVWIAEFLTKYNSDFHVISYITVRAILALLTALLLSLWIVLKVTSPKKGRRPWAVS